MRAGEGIEFGNYYNALRILYGKCDPSASSPNQEAVSNSDISEASPIPNTAKLETDASTARVNQFSLLEPFMESHLRKRSRRGKNEGTHNKNLLD